MEKFYQKYAPGLFENGYFPIPIKPRSKVPFMSKGESWKVEINKDQVDEWAVNGKGSGGVALTGIGGLDFDIKDKEASNLLIKYVRESISEDVLIRVGLAPKFLIPVAAVSSIDKKWKNTWFDGSGEKHEIEFLSPGDQYFLVYGIHPDTGEEYKWIGKDILSIHARDLPALDELDISGLEDEFDRIADEKGWTREGLAKKAKGDNHHHKNQTAKEALLSMKPPGEMSDPAGIKELAEWVSLLPQPWVDDRDNWITIGAAIHHETGGSNDGWVIFDHWSKGSQKYSGRKDTINRWESFDSLKGVQDGDSCCTRGTIIHVLKEAGVWDDAQKAGDIVRESMSVHQENDKSEGAAKGIVADMNKKHAVIRINSKIRIFQEGKNIDGMLDISFLSPADFHLMYSNKYAANPKDPKKSTTIDKIWLNSPLRKEYDGIVFEPTGGNKTKEQLERYYNIWRGLSVTPVKGDWGLFKDHIYNVIAAENEKIGAWIVAWVARMVKSPGGDRPGTSIVMKGGQGIGKGIFSNVIGKILGDHYMPVSHASQVTGRFNSHLTNKILVFIDEGFWAGDKQSEGVLKSMITEPYLAIEQKGVDIIKIKNNINLIMASNNDWVVPANIAERRFCVLDVSEKEQGNEKYFKDIVRQMYRDGGISAMLYDLLKMDISGINLRKFEHTQGLYEQKVHSMSIEMKYWHERLIDGEMLAYPENESAGSEFNDYSSNPKNSWGEINCKKLYQDYLIYSKNINNKYPLTTTQIGIFLRKICPTVQRKRRSAGKRRMYYRFPALSECRSLFEKQIKQAISWDTIPADDGDLF